MYHMRAPGKEVKIEELKLGFCEFFEVYIGKSAGVLFTHKTWGKSFKGNELCYALWQRNNRRTENKRERRIESY